MQIDIKSLAVGVGVALALAGGYSLVKKKTASPDAKIEAGQTAKQAANASTSGGMFGGGSGMTSKERKSSSAPDGMGEMINGFPAAKLSSLPPEAQSVMATLHARGAFPYRQDGQVFSNRERILPEKARGYYQEYTVVTPKSDTRGARRIIAGKGETHDFSTSGEYYYTADHYKTFSRIKE